MILLLLERRSSMSKDKVSALERRVSSLEAELRELKETLSTVVETERRRALADEYWRQRSMETALADL
jgi:hypothetical protein